MAYSKTFLLLGLLFAVVLIMSSEVSARELAETSAETKESVETVNPYYGGGGGGWHNGGGGGGGWHNGGGGGGGWNHSGGYGGGYGGVHGGAAKTETGNK